MLVGLAVITACGGKREEVAPDSLALAQPAPALSEPELATSAAGTGETDSALRRRLRDSAFADSATRDVVARILAGSTPPPPDTVPPSTEPVYVDEGACPGECCALGRWGAKATVGLRSRADSTAPFVGEVPAGTVVRADSSVLHIRPGRFVLNRDMRVNGLTSGLPYPLAAGDTIFIYTDMGEGYYRARRTEARDTLEEWQFNVPGHGCDGGRRNYCDGQLTAKPVDRWWVRIQSPGGIVGWTDESRQFAQMEGCFPEPFPDTATKECLPGGCVPKSPPE
jgi:hypothetical protein